jgi:hypothetical protein
MDACAFCAKGGEDPRLGALLGPLGPDAKHYVHRACALWSPNVRRSPPVHCLGRTRGWLPCTRLSLLLGSHHLFLSFLVPPAPSSAQSLFVTIVDNVVLAGRKTHIRSKNSLLQVFELEDGALKGVQRAIRSGRLFRCALCHERGASVGCRVHACRRSFHVSCAVDAGAAFYFDYQMSCASHNKWFKNVQRHPA